MSSNKVIKDAVNDTEKLIKLDDSPKSCFIIMPIADIPGYDSGHFLRVYEHIIKPACEIAGFTPTRSDEINSSHMIVVDILKKIVESDLAICDLSGRNPNVLYELGLRQAFNKKTVLIKDNKTENIFDVQGFRYTLYDSSLRIDNVKNEIQKFSMAINETYEAQGDINSIVQLLQIEPARIDSKTQLSESDTVIFKAVNDLKKSIEKLSINNNQSRDSAFVSHVTRNELNENMVIINNREFKVGSFYYEEGNPSNEVGRLIKIDYNQSMLVFVNRSKKEYGMSFSNPFLANTIENPFM